MTTTSEFTTSPPPPPAGNRPRVLRRSRTDRVGAGVSGGLGAYFNIDPVLFRVLFATSAFFGGAGILAYLLAWAAIPEEGTEHAAIDRWVFEMRRRRIPLWLVAIAAGILLWSVAFSWWAPGPFWPVMVVVVVLVAVFARRGTSTPPPTPPTAGPPPTAPFAAPFAEGQPDATVSLQKDGTAASPPWVGESRQWFAEARQASRERRRRAFPVRIAGVVALVLTLGTLGIIDAVTGIALPVYFWVTFGIVIAALLIGAVLRRTPWSLATLLIPAVIGMVGFGSTSASMHDGFGQRDWTPTTSVASEYRLAFGQGVLDLRQLVPQTAPVTIDVRMAAGQVRVLLPDTMNATVNANVHIGEVEVDGQRVDSTGAGYRHHDGFNLQKVILPPAGATGTPVTITVHLADGNISVQRG